jgi:hypothetical protein
MAFFVPCGNSYLERSLLRIETGLSPVQAKNRKAIPAVFGMALICIC